MPRRTVESWRPYDVEDLEPNAWTALKATTSSCVVAGPGSGKTELLAQRATYLLETGTCREPQRILAISFKKDAATNLRERVKRRCPTDLARRFTSMTFDSFTKSMVDRFRTILPREWRPSKNYEIVQPTAAAVAALIQYGVDNAPAHFRDEISGLPEKTFETEVLARHKLLPNTEPRTGTEWAVSEWLSEHLGNRDGSKLTFFIINRLAELIVRSSPDVQTALRLTFPFIFVDEFQDTTYAQFDFLQTAFASSEAVVTAVGDHKQRIMIWAGARPDAFQAFQRTFKAATLDLLCNFRSSPELVRIQHLIARAIDDKAGAVVSRSPSTVSGAVSQIWRPTDEAAEARHVADWIAADGKTAKLKPRDYALLVRQKTEDVEKRLQPEFSRAGLGLRNEARRIGKTSLQDLLAEELVKLALAILSLIVSDKDGDAWLLASKALVHIRQRDADDPASTRGCEDELTQFLEREKRFTSSNRVSDDSAAQVVARTLKLLDLSLMRQSYPEYSFGETLGIAVEALDLFFRESAKSAKSWLNLLLIMRGDDCVPLMTVHKSKGLEYHTIIFLGLDDEQWWSHGAANPEGTATFFVAFSRAKQRAFFTCCRDKRKRKVADLHQLLLDAGVPEIDL